MGAIRVIGGGTSIRKEKWAKPRLKSANAAKDRQHRRQADLEARVVFRRQPVLRGITPLGAKP